MAQPDVVDRAVKGIIQQAPGVFLRLAQLNIDSKSILPGDTAINLPEYRADHVFRIGSPRSRSRWAMLLEYQLNPRPKLVSDWFYKKYALEKQLGMRVLLVVIYLRRGRSRTFPSSDIFTQGSLTNEAHASTIHLWDHQDRIRSGELVELAPLLPLCQERPTRRTLEEGRELIEKASLSAGEKRYLFAIAAAIGARYVSAIIVQEVFRKEIDMIKGVSFIEEWMLEREEKGRTEGHTEGRTEEARDLVRVLLAERFGNVPELLEQRIAGADEAWCRQLLREVLRADSLEKLNSL